MRITTTIENLAEMLRAWGDVDQTVVAGSRAAVFKGCREGIDEMLRVRTWKDKTGKTRKAMRVTTAASPARGAEAFMEVASETASWLDSGTVPHIIRPKMHGGTKKAAKAQGRTVRGKQDVGTHRVSLRWYDGAGNAVFAKEVRHPGTKGDGFFGKGVIKCEAVMVREIEMAVDQGQKILDG
jgi:hypothetical protein